MVSVKNAKEIIAQHIATAMPAGIPLPDACGLMLAEDIKAKTDVPRFDNAAMDGYAFCYDNNVNNYKVTQQIRAGDFLSSVLKRGEAARIFTGASLPPGADTVIQQELTESMNTSIKFDPTAIKSGANVRVKGAQCRAGDLIAMKGNIITPGMVSLLVSAGMYEVSVFASPSVSLIVTGNELAEQGTTLQPGQIFNSNEPAAKAYLQLLKVKKIISFHVKDDAGELYEKVKYCLEQTDMLILTGGISVGDYDYVQSVLQQMGVKTLFYKVKQKPGKPLLVGKKENKWVFALPGNPAAVLTCFNQYVKPCLLAMMGHKKVFEPDAVLPLANEWKKKEGLTHFIKAKITVGKVLLLQGQDSFNLLPFNEADCFAELDEAEEYFRAGAVVNVYKW